MIDLQPVVAAAPATLPFRAVKPRYTPLALRWIAFGAALAVLWCAGLVNAATVDTPGGLSLTRHLSFETDEGTWVSVDLSPDGKTLVFDLLGDIYSLDVAGGNARPLLTGPAFEERPVFSPDGKSIAFLSDRNGSENLWVAAADGSAARPLSRSTKETFASPEWSADGKAVYVTRFQDRAKFVTRSAVWVYPFQEAHSRDGSDLSDASSRLVGTAGLPLDAAEKPEGYLAMGPARSADGRSVYFSAQTANLSEYGRAGPYGIYRRDLSTGATVSVVNPATAPDSAAGAMQPALSPDGRLLAYGALVAGSGELRIRDLQTGEDRRLVHPIEYPMVNWTSGFQGLFPRYVFTADSKTIVMAYGGKIRRVDVATAQSTIIPFKVKVELDVAANTRVEQRDDTGPVRARVIQAPSLSPDGRRLAFSAFGKLYVALATGGAAKRVTRTPMTADQDTENQPAWSPDGKFIVYVSWGRGGGHLWRVQPDGGSAPKRLTNIAAFYRRPQFSLDGRTLVALKSTVAERNNVVRWFGERPFPQDLISLPAQGGALTTLTQLNPSGAPWDDTPQPPDHGQPHFSGDGTTIYIHTRNGLQAVPATGGAPRGVIKVLTSNYSDTRRIAVQDIRLSSDGRWALAQANSQLHLLAIPSLGDAGSTVDLADPAVPHRRITDIGADYFDWADGGKSIVWAIGATYYKVPLSTVLAMPEQRSTRAAEDKLKGTKFVLELPRDVPAGAWVLRGVKAVTMRGDEVIDDADIVVERNRIAAIGKRGSVAIPAGARVLELTGKVVTPGFVDTHAHYTKALRKGVLDYAGWEMPVALAYGITTSLDPQSFTSDAFVYQDLIDAGVLTGPRAYTTGPGIFASTRINSKEEAVGILRRYKEHYGVNTVKSYMVGDRRQRQFVASAAQELGMMPITENWGMPRYSLTHAMDGFASNEHASDAVDYYADVVALYAQTGTGYSPTTMAGGASGLPATDYFMSRHSPLTDAKLNRFTPRIFLEQWRHGTWVPDEDFIFPRLAASAAKILRAGGHVGLGSHGEVQGLGYHWEMWALSHGGLTPHEILQISTRESAIVTGHLRDVGTLEPGKYADLLVFDRDPLANIENSTSLSLVIKNGRRYDAETLQER